MRYDEEAIIQEVENPVDGYKFNVQIWRKSMDGRHYYYCGNGRYFKIKDEAEAYVKELNKKKSEKKKGGSR